MGKKKLVKDGIEVMRSIYYGDRYMLSNALENNTNIDATNDFGETALMYACNVGNEEMVRKVVEYGANVNLQNNLGNTPIMYACDGGNKGIVEYLVNNGADVNIKRYDGKTALTCACGGHDVTLVEYLVNNGADVNCETRDGDTPLIRACDQCNFEIVRCLVDNGADVNAQNIVFDTALMHTVVHGITDENVKIVMYLVDNGADVDVMNTNIELRDFMRRMIAKEPKIGAIIAMRKEGLSGVRRFLEKFIETIQTECMIFLARSNTVRRLKEESELLEKQLKEEVLGNIKLNNPKKEIENIIRNNLEDQSNFGGLGILHKNSAYIVENVGKSDKKGGHVKNCPGGVLGNDKKQNPQSKRRKVKINKNTDKKDKGKVSIIDIINEKKLGNATPGVSVVSRIKALNNGEVRTK